MPERGGYAPGVPAWVDVTVPDLEAGRAFYGGTFGWDFETRSEEFGHYTMCEIGGWRVAGMTDVSAGAPNTPRWNVYLATDDAERTAAALTAAGGTVLAGPQDIPGEGRMLLAADPTGATVGFWQADRAIGAQLTDEPGAMAWHHLATRDPRRADDFYRALFGYQVRAMDGRVEDAAGYATAGSTVASRMRITDEWPQDMPAHWMTFFSVSNTDATVDRVRDLGGSLLQGPEDTPYGRLASLADPFGAVFAVVVPAAGGS